MSNAFHEQDLPPELELLDVHFSMPLPHLYIIWKHPTPPHLHFSTANNFCTLFHNFNFITPSLNFSRVQRNREREKKNMFNGNSPDEKSDISKLLYMA